jgi:phosphate transport system substrate-binding protein
MEAAMRKLGTLVSGAALAIALAVPAVAGEATGAGSTFVSPILAKWAAEYEATSGNRIAYQAVGSGGGISLLRISTVDFGVSDMPLPPIDLMRHGLLQFPLVIGGIVPVINLDGVAPGQLRFSGALLADIYLGKVRYWDDPAIQRLNPDVNLPHLHIIVVYRSDGSGTTFNWVNYLSKVSPAWKTIAGEGGAVHWPLGFGGKGNEGVAALVGLRKGAIGYVEYTYAAQKKLAYGLVQNRAGQFVKPDAESFLAAASTADWRSTSDFFLVMTNAPGERAYPITATAFILMPKKPKQFERAKVALDFFAWGVKTGRKHAETLDYAPLPESLVVQIENYWNAQFAP